MITEDSVVVAAPEQVASELNGEVVILNLKTGMYYGLNSVASSVWNLVQQPQDVRSVRDAILTKYAVMPDQCTDDVLRLLQELAAEELIDIS